MSSRKDLLKRSLGISDYPWSSDDDLETTLSVADEEAALHRPSTESHSNESNAPGTSGSSAQQSLPQQQQTHQQNRHREQQQMLSELNPLPRRSQSRIDREIFWSILNTPQHQITPGSARLRSGEIPVSYVSRVSHMPSAEGRRRGERPDVQRILAFKRLTRNLGSLRHRGTTSGVLPVTRANPGVIPDLSPSVRINRHYPYSRFVRSGPITVRAGFPPPYVELSPEEGAGRRHGRNSPDGEEHQLALAPQPSALDQPAPIEVNNNPTPPVGDAAMLNEQMIVEPDLSLEGDLEPEGREANNNSGANGSLEIVSIDLDSGDVQSTMPVVTVRHARGADTRTPSVDARAADTRTANVDAADSRAASGDARDARAADTRAASVDARETRAADSRAVSAEAREARAADTRTASVDARDAHAADARAVSVDVRDAPGPSVLRFPNMPSTTDGFRDASGHFHPNIIIIKKKHRSSDTDATAEPQSVKEFNQHLLRLLECPVCLEWMEPPMSQCRRGHLVCGRCRARLASCPVCRTTFSSVRNRAMEGVAEMLRYPCRHGCGREVRLRRRAPHEASCAARKYNCPAPPCADALPLPRAMLAAHFQSSEQSPGENSPQPVLSDRGQPVVDGGGQSAPPTQAEEVLLEADNGLINEGLSYPGIVEPSDWPFGGERVYLEALRRVMLNLSSESSHLRQNLPQRDEESGQPIVPAQSRDGQAPLPHQDDGQPIVPAQSRDGQVALAPQDGGQPIVLAQSRDGQVALAPQDGGHLIVPAQSHDGPAPLPHQDGGQPTVPAQSHDGPAPLPHQDGGQPIVLAQSRDGQVALAPQDGGQLIVPAQSHDGQAALPHQDGGQPIVPAQSHDGPAPLPHQGGGQQIVPAQSRDGQVVLPHQDGGQPIVPAQSHDGQAALPHQDGGQPIVPAQSRDGQVALPPQDGGQLIVPAQSHDGPAPLPHQGGGQQIVPAQSHDGPAPLPHQGGGQQIVPAQSHDGPAPLPHQGGGQQIVPAQSHDEQAALPHHDGEPPVQEPSDGLFFNYHHLIRFINEEMLNESRHLTIMKIGRRHRFTMKVNSELHENWLILAMEEYFHLRIDVDIRTWGVIVYVSYIGPKCDAKNFTYEVTIDGQHNQRKLVYARTTHSDMESSSLNMGRQDCFQLTLDQALNFIRYKNRHCDADRYLDFNVEIAKVERPAGVPRDDSDS